MCFLVLAVSQLFHSFNMRSEKSVFKKGKPKNPFVWISFFFCLSLQTAVILIPQAASLFGAVQLTVSEWAISLALSSVPLAVCEIYKLLKH
jgi:Ca2+-transporting ATPase